eukprot:TRINITY_DN13076_c0_g1_i1.p1 TRINITY_DN13076_c0_g1~~TRINITY_DN13076_c0_g1_i1.p1  ORF type:complete len:216 (+),score=33.96 TRINITY_DN13076_c0_g1_i1:36-683(+)
MAMATAASLGLPVSEADIKLVFIGDGAVGKTSYVITMMEDFPVEYVPTVMDIRDIPFTFEGQSYSVGLWDTTGRGDYEALLPLMFEGATAFVLSFSLISSTSFANITERWLPIIQHHAPTVPFVLMGTKYDLLEDPATLESLRKKNVEIVSRASALQLVETQPLGIAYVETSALKRHNVNQVIEEVLRYREQTPSKQSKKSLTKKKTLMQPCVIS